MQEEREKSPDQSCHLDRKDLSASLNKSLSRTAYNNFRRVLYQQSLQLRKVHWLAQEDRIRDNLRFEFVCGKRALSDYRMRVNVLRDVTNRFSSSEADLMDVVEKLFQDHKTQKKRNRQMQESLSTYEAREVIGQAEGRIIKKRFDGKSVEEARLLALNIIKASDHIVLFGLKLEERVHLILACPENSGLDMRELVPLMASIIEGKGGGRPSLIEISGSRMDRLSEALDAAYKTLENPDNC